MIFTVIFWWSRFSPDKSGAFGMDIATERALLSFGQP